jgi:hypothetical protein
MVSSGVPKRRAIGSLQTQAIPIRKFTISVVTVPSILQGLNPAVILGATNSVARCGLMLFVGRDDSLLLS